MAITKTNLHYGRVVDQISQNLVGLQRDMNRNAETHKAMALAESPPFDKLLAYVTDSATKYIERIEWIENYRGDSGKDATILDQLLKMGWNIADFTTPMGEMKSAALNLQSATMKDFAGIIAACDALLAVVDKPESIWPE